MASKENGAIIYLLDIIHRINNSSNRLNEMHRIAYEYNQDYRDQWLREEPYYIKDIDMHITPGIPILFHELDGDTCLTIELYHASDPNKHYYLHLDTTDIFIVYRAEEILRQPYYTDSTDTEKWIVREIYTTLKNRRTQNVQRNVQHSGNTERKSPSLRF